MNNTTFNHIMNRINHVIYKYNAIPHMVKRRINHVIYKYNAIKKFQKERTKM